MTDEERAAKAARAKALLKSHQKKKKVGASVPSNLSQLAGSSQGTPSIASVSATFSPPQSEAPLPDDRSEFGGETPSKAVNGEADVSSLFAPAPPSRYIASPLATPSSSLPPSTIISPPPPEPTPPSKPSTPAVDVSALQTIIQNQQQTISFLVDEKNALTANLEHLQGIEERSRESDKLLEEGRTLVEDLTRRVTELEKSYNEASVAVTRLSEKEKELSERSETTDRELRLSKQTASDLKAQLTQQRQRVRQLEEQIEGDDRVEQMEKSMKGLQDRAESLEFQLNKAKQTHAKTKAERDAFEQKLKEQTDNEAQWQAKHDELQQQLDAARASLAEATSNHERILSDHKKLQNQHSTAQASLSTLQQRLSQLSSDHSSASRQLSAAQSELSTMSRRVSQAEDTLKGLQKENEELVTSLNEMRTKTVELSQDKVELAERVQNLEHGLKTRDETIASLEAAVDQANAHVVELEEHGALLERQHQQQLSDVQRIASEHQQGYGSIQTELLEAQKVIKDLTADRSATRQTLSELQAEVDRLRATQESIESEKKTLREELNDRARGGDEVTAMLSATREEIEALRAEVTLKDEELLRVKALLEEANLRASAMNSPTLGTSPSNLSEEMMEVVKQQHALELSGANSQIRSLETSLFQEQAKTHTMQRRITALEDDLHIAKMQAATTSTPNRAFSPHPPPSAKSLSYALSPTMSDQTSSEYRRPLGAIRRPVLEDGLSDDVRHKRKISLSMLKARIDSEMALRVPLSITPNGTTPRMSRLDELEEEPVQVMMPSARPQFGDEEHVFCCACCTGDLVVL